MIKNIIITLLLIATFSQFANAEWFAGDFSKLQQQLEVMNHHLSEISYTLKQMNLKG